MPNLQPTPSGQLQKRFIVYNIKKENSERERTINHLRLEVATYKKPNR